MENIFEKIDSIFDGYTEDKPRWANEIIEELKEIKLLLKNTNQTVKKFDKNYYNFIKEFRIFMKADTYNKIYPKIKYNDKTLGVNFKGYLYDVNSHDTLSKDEAFNAYEYFYTQKDNLNIFK